MIPSSETGWIFPGFGFLMETEIRITAKKARKMSVIFVFIG
jgi:hypothetical protein